MIARAGITRVLPGASESDAIKYGRLSDAEKEIYRALFYEKTATTTMLNEVSAIKENAKIVQNKKVPQVPMLMFLSNGDGTRWEEDAWRGYQSSYIKDVEDGKLINLDCPHYVHNYEYEKISEEIKAFLIINLIHDKYRVSDCY